MIENYIKQEETDPSLKNMLKLTQDIQTMLRSQETQKVMDDAQLVCK